MTGRVLGRISVPCRQSTNLTSRRHDSKESVTHTRLVPRCSVSTLCRVNENFSQQTHARTPLHAVSSRATKYIALDHPRDGWELRPEEMTFALGPTRAASTRHTLLRLYSTMATSYRFDVGRDSGILRFERDEKTAAKVSELLQKDLEARRISLPSWLNNASVLTDIGRPIMSTSTPKASIIMYADRQCLAVREAAC